MATTELNKRQPALATTVIDSFLAAVVATGRYTIQLRSKCEGKAHNITLEGFSKTQIAPSQPVELSLPAPLPTSDQKTIKQFPEENTFSDAQLEMLDAMKERERSMSLPIADQIKREAVIASSLRSDEISRSALSEFTSAFRMSSYRRH